MVSTPPVEMMMPFAVAGDLSSFSCSVRLILARRFSSSFSGESKIVKSRPVAEGSAPEAPLACVLSNASSTSRLDLILAVPMMPCIQCDPNGKGRFDPEQRSSCVPG